jgi:hypothetical protein
MPKPPRSRRTQPAREADYKRMSKRVDRVEHHLEDTIGHFYKVINVLRERVSMLEEEVKGQGTDLLEKRG